MAGDDQLRDAVARLVRQLETGDWASKDGYENCEQHSFLGRKDAAQQALMMPRKLWR